ncbi:MAG: hydantoinase B/oxoprolinase family protein [Armatimonadetes bacterium]|nr:hydantoinase B/oxoprolinase family protein [Armatimonadota bacterium]
MNPVSLEVHRHRLVALCEEMGATLCRCAYSPNIKERRDYSCALFDPAGRMAAQAAHIPVHLGAMPLSVASALAAQPLGPGDVVLLNDPYAGGSHLPDWTVLSGVFRDGECVAVVANRAHHADVGGLRPGSMGEATEIHQEGLRIPPVRLVRGGRLDADVEALLLANTRTPEERRGDLAAQLAALRVGEARVLQLAGDELGEAMAALQDYTERVLRATLRAIPDGTYAFDDAMDDGTRIAVRLSLAGDSAEVDLRDSGPQQPGPNNAVRAVTISAATYCFACLLPRDVPLNDGCFRPLAVLTRPGSLVDALPPAAVAGGNVETSQRIVDVVLGALAQALPERIPAASQGTMNNLLMGGVGREGTPFTYYETIAGGMGARPGADGLSGVHVHMTNTLNTPAEAVEYAYPLRVERYELREGTGGAGRYRGGDGIRRDVRALCDCEATLLTERRVGEPYGLRGAAAGRRGRNVLLPPEGERELGGQAAVSLRAGDVLSVRTPGGGGWGRATEE